MAVSTGVTLLGPEGRYKLLRLLGEGGMGKVYEAFDRERNTPLALKTLSELTPLHLSRFKNEFRSLADLRHPNLVALDELHESDGTWFFTMELVHGTNFLRWVRPGRASAQIYAQSPGLLDSSRTVDTAVGPPLPPVGGMAPALAAKAGATVLDESRLRAALPQLVRGLVELHQAGKVHRDVKPGNVLVTDVGRVVILDFGLITDDDRGHRETGFVGTVAYAAPEQIAFQPVGPAADWYAVGVTLYVSLAGWLPFVGLPSDVLKRKQIEDAERPSEQLTGVPVDLEDLCMELLARDPARRPDGPSILARLGGPLELAPRRRTLFVGRLPELAACERAFEGTRHGEACAVLVHGESGVGKSALVRAFLEVHDRPGQLVLAGRCYERESVPYKGLDQLMEGLAEHLAGLAPEEQVELLPARARLIAELFPSFTSLVAGEAPPAVDVNRDAFLYRASIFAAVRELLTRLAHRRPLVLALDDLQWADADSLALLAELFREPAPPLLLVATVRTAAGARAFGLDFLRAHLGRHVEDVEVGRLPPGDALELAGRLLGDDAGAAAIAEGAEGHPLFIDALVRRRLAGSGAGRLRLDEAIVERASALGDAPARLLEVICVAGGPIQQEACAHAAGTPFGAFAQLVTTLRAAHLVKTHGVKRGDLVEPYHDRVREAIAAHLEVETRRDVHARLGRALEGSGSADAETLATHFREAGDGKKAARYTARAADVAREAFAFDRAARLYRAALELDPDTPATQHRLRLRLADALGLAGQNLAAAHVYLETCATASDEEERLSLNRLAAEHFLRCGRVDSAVVCLDQVLAPMHWRVPRSKLHAVVAFLLERRRLRRRGLGFTPRDPATLSDDQRRRLDVLSSIFPLGMMDTLRGHTFQMRNLRLSLDTGQPDRIVRALTPEMVFVAATGKQGEAEVAALDDLASRIAAELGDVYLQGVIDCAMGVAENILGRFRRSLKRCDVAEQLLRDRCVGAAWELGSARVFALRSLGYLGELNEIGRRLPYALKEAGERGDLYVSSNIRLGLPIALLAMAHDDLESARRHSREALEEWPNTGTQLQHCHAFMGDLSLDLYAGDLEGAERRIAAWWKRLVKSMYLRVQLTRVGCTSLRARVAVAQAAASAGSERKTHLAAARRDAARLVEEASPAARAYAALLSAGAAAVDGDLDAARADLEVGEKHAEEGELGLFVAAARRQRGRLERGQAGAQLVATAEAFMAAQSIQRPGRFAAVLVPGFPE